MAVARHAGARRRPSVGRARQHVTLGAQLLPFPKEGCGSAVAPGRSPQPAALLAPLTRGRLLYGSARMRNRTHACMHTHTHIRSAPTPTHTFASRPHVMRVQVSVSSPAIGGKINKASQARPQCLVPKPGFRVHEPFLQCILKRLAALAAPLAPQLATCATHLPPLHPCRRRRCPP